MAKNAATAKIDVLAEDLLRALDSLRQQGGDHYPPTLRRLAELCEESSSIDDVRKAVGKKPFSEKAVVLEKEGRLLKLDSPVYFKEDKPSAKELKARALDALTEGMLRVLESRRQTGGNAYPPTLRQLVEHSDGSPDLKLAVEAASKKPFTDQAVATQKEKNKPRPDSPVYVKGDEPDETKMLAERMLQVLESQRRLGPDSYPPTLRRLVDLCDMKTTDKRLAGVLCHKLLSDRLVVASKGKTPNFDSPAYLSEDAQKAIPALVAFALSLVRTGAERAFTASKLAKPLASTASSALMGALKKGQIEHLGLPQEVAWIAGTKGEPLLFHVDDIMPAAREARPSAASHARTRDGAPAPRSHFAEAFREAFDQLDRRNGATNFVKLADLRRALPEVGRAEFDDGLRQLRSDRRYSLNSHEGRLGALTSEEREAGIQELGSFYVYASRR